MRARNRCNRRLPVPPARPRGAKCARLASIAFVVAIGIAHAPPTRADVTIPANSVMTLMGGTLDLGCTDLIDAGTLQVGTGSVVTTRNVSIQAGGVIDSGSGSITLGGNWSDAGTLVGGTGSVRFRDGCALTAATVTGNTTFATASFVSTTGKNYVFAVGSTQTVYSLLEISGTSAQPIQFRSGNPGQVANINLASSGTQQIQHVGVTDVWATGQWLAPNLSNEGGGGNASRWFGTPTSAGKSRPIPTLDEKALPALAALLALIGGLRLRRRTARIDAGGRPQQGTRR